jgi:hypothetical protein
MTVKNPKNLTAQEAFDRLIGLPTDKAGEKYGCTLLHMQTYTPTAEVLRARPARRISTDEVTAVWRNAESIGLVFAPLGGTTRSTQFTKGDGHTLDDVLASYVTMGEPIQLACRWPEGARPPRGLVSSCTAHEAMARPGEWELLCRISAATD